MTNGKRFVSLKLKFNLLFLLIFIFVIGIFYIIQKKEEGNFNNKLQTQTLLFIYDIMPLLSQGDLPNLYQHLWKNAYFSLNQIPKNTKIIYKTRMNLADITIFRNASVIGFEIQYLDEKIVAYTSIVHKVDEDDYSRTLLFGVLVVLILLYVSIMRTLVPLNQLTLALLNFSNFNKNEPLEIKRNDEIGRLFEVYNKMREEITMLVMARALIIRNIAHELKTPLAKMKLALKLVPLEIDKMQRYINSVNRAVDNMLAFEKLNSNNMPLQKSNFNLNTLLLEALENIEDLSNDSAYNLAPEDIEIISQNFTIFGDYELLLICVRNLIGNALKYSTSNNPKVKITAKEGKIAIANKGTALKYDIKYYIKPFYRDDTNLNIQGYGLGLSIVESILRLHNMRLGYEFLHGEHIFSIDFVDLET